MKSTTAANAALASAAIGWALFFHGGLMQMGDPAPGTPREALRSAQQLSSMLMIGGVSLLLAALWLSGYAFRKAQRRAVIAAGMCLLPALAILLSLLGSTEPYVLFLAAVVSALALAALLVVKAINAWRRRRVGPG